MLQFLKGMIGIGLLFFVQFCSSSQTKDPAIEPSPVVEKKSYPKPSPTERKFDDNGCQIYKKENFPPAQGSQDGRFTLGVQEKRIMYGYPLPLSTSHFIIQVGDLYASNTNVFGCKAEYILSEGENLDRVFQFHGIEITQKLIPVTKDLQSTESPDDIQYYKIEYHLNNMVDYAQKVNFLLLIDTMIADNDAAKFSINNELIQTERKLSSDQLPKNILVFQEPKNYNKIVGEFLIQNPEANPPSELYLGKWPEFHKTLKDIKIAGDTFSDSAVLLNWKELELEPSNSQTISTFYGLQSTKFGGLQHRFNHTSGNQKSISILFETNSFIPGPKEKEKLQNFLKSEVKDSNVLGVAITGYADAQGQNKNNLILSQRRMQSTFKIVKDSIKLKENLFLLKAAGSSMADQSNEAQKKGNDSDRKAEIIFFVE
jgi:outer membrane protein OmpA-like peptidoglycan-associated protein